MEIHVGRIATRVYIGLLIIGILAFVIYKPRVNDTHTAIIHSPSLEQFEKIKMLYSPTLICNCSRLSISYGQIMNIQPRYHQICSSVFLTDVWSAYFDFGLAAAIVQWYPFDFRISGQGIYGLLKVLCAMANETVYNAMANFNATNLITVNAFSRIEFNAQTTIILEQFQLQTIASFKWLFEVSRISINNNQLFAATSSNALFDQQNNETIYFSPVLVGNCSCGTSS